MCFNYFYKRRYGISKPKQVVDADYSILRSKLQSEFPKAHLLLSDWEYKLAPFTEYERLIRWSLTDKNKYIKESYDCDDFSFSLMGDFHQIPEWGSLAFGIFWLLTPAHAVNMFVDDEYKVWVVEPQTDNIFKFPKDWVEDLVMM